MRTYLKAVMSDPNVQRVDERKNIRDEARRIISTPVRDPKTMYANPPKGHILCEVLRPTIQ